MRSSLIKFIAVKKLKMARMDHSILIKKQRKQME